MTEEPHYVITLDSHDYYGPFANQREAHYFIEVRKFSATRITTELTGYERNQLQKPTITRPCFGCGAIMTPFSSTTYTAHEFKCGKINPDLIPQEFRAEHASLLVWERRSAASKRGAATRKAKR